MANKIQILNNGDALYDIRRKINENFEITKDSIVVMPYGQSVPVEERTTGKLYFQQLYPDNVNSYRIEDSYGNTIMAETNQSKNTTFCVNSGNLTPEGIPDILYVDSVTGEVAFRQPALTSNGTIGQGQFAVSSEGANYARDVWKAFDNDANTAWVINEENSVTTIYSAKPFKLTEVTLAFSSAFETPSNITVYGSNTPTYSTTNRLIEVLGNTQHTRTLTLNNQNEYNYYFIRFINLTGTQLALRYVTLTGSQQADANVALQYRGSLTATTANNISFTLSQPFGADLTGYPDGVYNVFIGADGVSDVYNNVIYRQTTQPEGELNDVWFKTLEPTHAYRYNGSMWVGYDKVPVGQATVTDGNITDVLTFDFNQNGYNVNAQTLATPATYGLIRTAAPEDEIDCSCNDAGITPANLYDLNNYRRVNTEYNVDDKVGCPYHHNLQLLCIQAGTTSEQALDTKTDLSSGTTIQDGTVVWKVEELGTGGGASINDKITDCLLQVPQKINVELADGVLTLKAGSKVIVPNGAGVFDEVVIQNDLTMTTAGSGSDPCFIVYRSDTGSLGVSSVSLTTSGTTAPTGNGVWYDTKNNIVYNYTGGTVANANLSFPIAIISRTTGVINSLDQIFNGMGYIGSTIWVDKGVKGLVPNGRNGDGTLNNIEARTENVLIYNYDSGSPRYASFRSPQNGVWTAIDYKTITSLQAGTSTKNWYFDKENNYWMHNGRISYNWVDFAYMEMDTASPYNITLFQPKLPFKAVDHNHLETEIAGTKEQLTEQMDTKISTTKTELTTQINTKVNKAGDTLTGNLTLNKDGGQVYVTGTGWKGLTIKSTEIDYTLTNQTSLNNARFIATDKNGQWHSYWQSGVDSNGGMYSAMASRRSIDGTAKQSALIACVDKNGVAYATAPTPSTGDNSTKIATTAWVNSTINSEVVVVTQTYTNGTSWYRVWSDKWCEQGGITGSYASGTLITLLKPFANTNYSVMLIPTAHTSDATSYNFHGVPENKTTKQFSAHTNATFGALCWQACGYIP